MQSQPNALRPERQGRGITRFDSGRHSSGPFFLRFLVWRQSQSVGRWGLVVSRKPEPTPSAGATSATSYGETEKDIMLILSRRSGESVMIGDVRVTITQIEDGRVRIAINAPGTTPIYLGESPPGAQNEEANQRLPSN